MKDHRLLLSFDVSASRYGPGSAVPARACNLEQYSDGTVDQLSPTSGPVRNSSSLPPSDCTTATQHRRTVNTRANLPPLYTPYGRSRVSSSPSVAPHRLATLVPGQPGPSSLRDQLDPRYIKMQFYIPPHRGAIWQEYLDRQAVERRNRLEMAKHIMTWYSDLESEVAQHFQKALEGSAAKRRRLVADSSCSEPPSPLLSADNCDVADCKTMSWQVVHTPSPSHRLPSLFPHVPGLPEVTMTYPDYYHYTSEVDPLISDQSDEDFDFSPTQEAQFTANRHHQTNNEWMDDGFNWAENNFINDTTHLPAAEHPGEVVWPESTIPHQPAPYNISVVCDVDTHYQQRFLQAPVDGVHSLYPGSIFDRGHSEHEQLHLSHPFAQSSNSPPDAQFSTSSLHQSEAKAGDAFSPSSLSHLDPASADNTDSLFNDYNLPLDFTICATAEPDDVMDSEDDIIDNIRLDWTEEEKIELKTIVV